MKTQPVSTQAARWPLCAIKKVPATGVALCCALLFPALLSSQRPQLPGRLRITSTPQGAKITIDDQHMNQSTDFTFAVSPGEHSVAVVSPDLPKCAKPIKATVSSGSVTSVNCTVAGWDKPAPR